MIIEDYNIVISEKQKIALMEVLIFALSPDVCAEWSKDNYDEFLELIRVLNMDYGYVKLPNIYLAKGGVLEDKKLIKKIKNYVKLKSK